MPLLDQSSFPGPPWYLFNGHLETVIPSRFRKVPMPAYAREQLSLSDGDFLDLDWVRNGNSRLIIISHGLEGSSHRHYVRGMVHAFLGEGYDVLAWNCRSCGGEMNRLPRLYHHGATEDLSEVVDQALTEAYESVVLLGFSMGGSLTLKYLGENGDQLDKRIKGGIAFSVPVHLWESVNMLEAPSGAFYRRYFFSKLKPKLKRKAIQFPDLINVEGIDEISSFLDFDNRYSAPLHGYRDAEHFYRSIESQQFVGGIQRPSLLVNAYNDPLLSPKCFDPDLAKGQPFLTYERIKKGGHVGFMTDLETCWAEERALAFARTLG